MSITDVDGAEVVIDDAKQVGQGNTRALHHELAAALPYIIVDLLRSRNAPVSGDGSFDKRLRDQIELVAREVASSSGLASLTDGEILGELIVGAFMQEVIARVEAVLSHLARDSRVGVGSGAEKTDLAGIGTYELLELAREAGRSGILKYEIPMREELMKRGDLEKIDRLTNFTFLATAYRAMNRFDEAIKTEEARLKLAKEEQGLQNSETTERKRARLKSEVFLSTRNIIILRELLERVGPGDQAKMLELCRDMVVDFDCSDIDKAIALDSMAISYRRRDEDRLAMHVYRALYALRTAMLTPQARFLALLANIKTSEIKAGIQPDSQIQLGAGKLPTSKLIGWAMDAREDQHPETVIVLQGEILRRAKAENDHDSVRNAYLVASFAYEARWAEKSPVNLDEAKGDLDKALLLVEHLLEYQKANGMSLELTNRRLIRLRELKMMAFGRKG